MGVSYRSCSLKQTYYDHLREREECADDHDLKSFGPLLDYALSFERTLECKDCWAPRSGGLRRVEVVQKSSHSLSIF